MIQILMMALCPILTILFTDKFLTELRNYTARKRGKLGLNIGMFGFGLRASYSERDLFKSTIDNKFNKIAKITNQNKKKNVIKSFKTKITQHLRVRSHICDRRLKNGCDKVYINFIYKPMLLVPDLEEAFDRCNTELSKLETYK